MRKQKRVAAIHDISCFGKCSLTVVLPVLSAAGLEACCIPTAVLSTHTGGFSGYTYRDLTEDVLPVAAHWKSLNLHFDAVYTGYLGSLEQVDILKDVLDTIADENSMIVIDPVMGDNGSLYAGFTEAFPKAMAGLCGRADVIVPNITEACLLLGKTYHNGPYTQAEIDELMNGLETLGAKKIVLTGVYFDNSAVGAAVLDAVTGERATVLKERIDGFYHGTGDVYASALTAALLRDFSLTDSARIAAEFTVESIKATQDLDENLHYGVNFEQTLPRLIRMLEKGAE